MGVTIHEQRTKYCCPNCKHIVKVEYSNSLLTFLYIITIIPLIIILVKKIIKSFTAVKNVYGDEIIFCPNCYKKLVIHES